MARDVWKLNTLSLLFSHVKLNDLARQVSLEVEISLRVIVADVFHHLCDKLHFLGGQLAVFHVLTDEVAQAAAEVFVARVGEERAAVGQHAYETAQQTEYREGVHLAFHAVELVVEPPSAAEL